MTLGDRLRKSRFELRLTQQKMAELIGVNAKSIQKWETEGANIVHSKRQNVAKSYQIPVSEVNKLCLELEETNKRNIEARKSLRIKRQGASVIDEYPCFEIGDALVRDTGSRFVDVDQLEAVEFYGKDGKPRKYAKKRKIRF